jgi:ABC-type multidrug transport system fused ATPase/permease subunit
MSHTPKHPTAGAPSARGAGADTKPGVWEVVVPLFRPYRWFLGAATTLNALHGFAITFQIFAAAWLVDWVLRHEQAPWFLQQVMSLLGLPDRLSVRLAVLAVTYFLVSVFGRMLTWHCGYRIFTWVREQVLTDLREQFFRQVNHLCLRFHIKRSSGELFSYLFGSPLSQIVQFYQHCSICIAGAVVTLISAVMVTLGWDWVLTCVLAVMVFAKVSLMERARRRNREIQKEFQQIESTVSGSVADLLRGTRAVKLHAMEENAAEEFGSQVRMIARKSYERDVRFHVEYMKQETVDYLCFALLMGVCAWRHLAGVISLGQVTGFMMAYSQLQGPLAMISQAFTLFGGAQASIERLGEVMRAVSSTPDPVGTAQLVPAAGEIEFRGVDFSYEEKSVLQGVNLRIPYGQRVALVGPSGGGKSTIAMLMLRMYDPDRGSVTLAGVDLRHCRGVEIRRRFGVVPQDPFIFRTTLRQNLKVARPDADDALLERACRQANAWDFISQLPEGLNTRLGEGGANLSGGQRQRLAIARAILADAPFLLFDEATSALDTLSEQLVQQTIGRITQGRTAIVIAHRLATVKECDRIVVIKEGRIVQDGSYAELSACPGLFRELVEGQQLLA